MLNLGMLAASTLSYNKHRDSFVKSFILRCEKAGFTKEQAEILLEFKQKEINYLASMGAEIDCYRKVKDKSDEN